MAVFDADGNLIWSERTKIDDETFQEAIEKAKTMYSAGGNEAEELIELSDGTKF